MKPSNEGAVCLFTIKNPSYPEHTCLTDSGAMCVDIHPKYPYMVVVGLYDGNVLVFNVQATCKKPAFKSNAVVNKHVGIIWEVCKKNRFYFVIAAKDTRYTETPVTG